MVLVEVKLREVVFEVVHLVTIYAVPEGELKILVEWFGFQILNILSKLSDHF